MRIVSIVLTALLALPAAAQTPPARPAAPAPAQQTKPPAKDNPLPTLNMVVPQRDPDAAFASPLRNSAFTVLRTLASKPLQALSKLSS